MKYFGGCDVGSTYTKAVILDENGKIAASTIMRSKINAEQSSRLAMSDCISKIGDISKPEELTYIVGTGYGRNRVPFAQENVSEISCHAMGVHVTDPTVKAIIDIGGATEVYACATHGVLSGPAIERIQASPIKELVLLDSIALPKEKRIDKITLLPVAPVFAEAIQRIYDDEPVSPLFNS